MKPTIILAALVASASAAPKKPVHTLEQYIYHKIRCTRDKDMNYGELSKTSSGANYILPMSQKEPNKKFQATEWAQITPNDRCAIFNIPLDSKVTAGKRCNLIFSFAGIAQMKTTGKYKFEGGGHFQFTGYNFNVSAKEDVTTWNNQPDLAHEFVNPPPYMKEGNSYMIAQWRCEPDKDQGPWNMAVTMCSTDSTFSFKQTNERCPLGFYVVLTDKPVEMNGRRTIGDPEGQEY